MKIRIIIVSFMLLCVIGNMQLILNDILPIWCGWFNIIFIVIILSNKTI